MKKPDREQQRYLNLLLRRRHIKTSRKNAQKKRKKFIAENQTRSYSYKTIRVAAPAHFEISNSHIREEVVNFISRIRYLLGEGANVKIDFDATVKLSSGATLFFVAMLEKLIADFPGRLTCNYPVDPIVEQMFQSIGLLAKLGSTSRVTITAENVKHWHYVTGTTTDLSALESLFDILSVQLSDETAAGLFESVSEAITNVIHHAYDGASGRLPELGARWWLFAQLKEGKLEIAICDLGIGIPSSLKGKPELSAILPTLIRKMRKRVSSGMIEIAVESSRSRTKLPHRGKGLPDMLTFSKQASVGGFLIVSHRGHFQYGSRFAVEIARDFYPPVNGTVIVWQIPLQP